MARTPEPGGGASVPPQPPQPPFVGPVPNGPLNPDPGAPPPIPGVNPFADATQKMAPIGYEKLKEQIASSGLKPLSADADRWLLNQSLDPSDADYNIILQGYKASAQQRQDLRAKFPNTTPLEEQAIEQGQTPPAREPVDAQGLTPQERSRVNQADAASAQRVNDANVKVANENKTRGQSTGPGAPVVLDANGNPVGGAAGGQTPKSSSQSGALSGGSTASGQDLGSQVTNGNYVWIGTSDTQMGGGQAVVGDDGKPIKGPDGKPVVAAAAGNLRTTSDTYMSVDDAKAQIATWSPDQIKQFQHAMHLQETGLPDTATFDKWGQVIDTSARLTKAGKHMSPAAVMQSMVKQAKGSGGGGGGGGGGLGAAKFQKSDVQAMLTGVTQKELGRDPTQQEIDQFYNYFVGLGQSAMDTASPSQLATDWIRSNKGGEAGSYGAATNYYQAMLSILGGSATGGAA